VERVALGIPSYGPAPVEWWLPLLRWALQAQEIEKAEVVTVFNRATMDTATNRNTIARMFLKFEPLIDWLWWIDYDNVNKPGALRRLLDIASRGHTLVGGVYFGKNEEANPIMYDRMPDGTYKAKEDYTPGEIIQADAMGMNSLLCHRSVLEDIEKNYVALQRKSGGTVAVHLDDLRGDVFDSYAAKEDELVVDGVFQQRLYQPASPIDVPFFALEYRRTEDIGFFEMARRCGHWLVVDTGAEGDHLIVTAVTGKDYREKRKERLLGEQSERTDPQPA